MNYYLAFDGGGTKLNGLLFNSNYEPVAIAASSGINPNVHGHQAAEDHIRQCVDTLFEKAAIHIPCIEAIISAESAAYTEAVTHHCPVKEHIIIGEGCMGALSSGLTDAICILSGTGSDVFVVENATECREKSVGGWGFVLDDDGSGVWIGKQAIRSHFRYLEGRGEKSLMHTMLEESYGLYTRRDVFVLIYRASSPAYQVGQICKLVNQAAEAGDVLAISILQQAGTMLAQSAVDVIHRIPENPNPVICMVGGVIRNCRLVREAIFQYLQEHCSHAELRAPIFEPIMGGVLYCMVHNGVELTSSVLTSIQEKYPNFVI